MHISGRITLKSFTAADLPPGSCLTIYIQESITCGGSETNCQISLAGNQTLRNLTMQQGAVVPYEMFLPKMKQGNYMISAVLNMGWCRVNSVKTSMLIHEGDYHTTMSEEVSFDGVTKSVAKDLQLDVVTISEIGKFTY